MYHDIELVSLETEDVTVGSVHASGEAIYTCIYVCIVCAGHPNVCKFESHWSTPAQRHTSQSNTVSPFLDFKSRCLVF